MTCHGMRSGSLPPAKSSSRHEPSCSISPKTNPAPWKRPFASVAQLVGHHRRSWSGIALLLVTRKRVESATISSESRNQSEMVRDVHAGADSRLSPCHGLCHSIFLPSLFHDYCQQTISVFLLRDIKVSSDPPQDSSHNDRIWAIPDYLGIQRSGSHQPRAVRILCKSFQFPHEPLIGLWSMAAEGSYLMTFQNSDSAPFSFRVP